MYVYHSVIATVNFTFYQKSVFLFVIKVSTTLKFKKSDLPKNEREGLLHSCIRVFIRLNCISFFFKSQTMPRILFTHFALFGLTAISLCVRTLFRAHFSSSYSFRHCYSFLMVFKWPKHAIRLICYRLQQIWRICC